MATLLCLIFLLALPSSWCASIIVSTESAISSREGSE